MPPQLPVKQLRTAGLVYIGLGVILVYFATKDVPVLEGLRSLARGEVPKKRDKPAWSPITGGDAPLQVGAGGGTGTVQNGVVWAMDKGVSGASDKLIWAFAQQVAGSVGVSLTAISGYRPGSTVNGGPDNHSKGQAVDVRASEAELDKFYAVLAAKLGGQAGTWVTNAYFLDLGWRVPGHSPGDNMHIHLGMSLAGVTLARTKVGLSTLLGGS